jgi:hypothetical protein
LIFKCKFGADLVVGGNLVEICCSWCEFGVDSILGVNFSFDALLK